MADWRQSLADVDEDYLVGISNKGIVKRAYKDLEAEGEKAQEAAKGIDLSAEDLSVTAGSETVTLRLPLAESRCSCPSRSICRHVIMAVLIARQAAAEGSGDGESLKDSGGNTGAKEVENSGGSAGAKEVENSGGSAGAKEVENSGGSTGAKEVENSGGSAGAEKVKNSGSSAEMKGKVNGRLSEKVWQEILAQPLKPLLRALGTRGLHRLTAMMKAGQVPVVERGSTVRMGLPGQEISVKLLSPLEYSTCSCHRKELCSHKAEAILWCQYLEKKLTVEQLDQESDQQPGLDMQELSGAAEQIRDCLEHLLETGLARSGEEQARELERLAILCHNVGLPGWEGDLRALAEGYGKYLRRAAGQSVERLAEELYLLYHKTDQLITLLSDDLSATSQSVAERSPQAPIGNGAEHARSSGITDASKPSAENVSARIQALAGEFRSQYLPVGDLELTGITMEHFVSDSGYEGDTVYFLDTAAGTWYTYTNARPTFYEGKRRSAYQEKAQAPWGIALSLESLARMRILLRGAKSDGSGRLSSSQETRGEILGKSELTADILKDWYYREYDRLFQDRISAPGRETPGRDRPGLVFVQAAKFQQGRFNEITQKLELPIWDEQGRRVLVELPYSKREEASIRYLERMKRQGQPCFLGKIYLRDSQICLYPVDVLERQELEQINISAEKNDRGDDEGHVTDTERASAACQNLRSYLEELRWLLQDIYQAGTATVQDSMLQTLREAREQGKTYGMTTMSDWLRQLEEQISGARHRFQCQPAPTMEIYCRLWRYVGLCIRRTAYDMARLSYCGR